MLHSTGSFIPSAVRSDVCSGDEFTMLRKKNKRNILTLGEKMHFEKTQVDLCSKEQGSFPSILQSEAKFLLSDCGCVAELYFT